MAASDLRVRLDPAVAAELAIVAEEAAVRWPDRVQTRSDLVRYALGALLERWRAGDWQPPLPAETAVPSPVCLYQRFQALCQERGFGPQEVVQQTGLNAADLYPYYYRGDLPDEGPAGFLSAVAAWLAGA